MANLSVSNVLFHFTGIDHERGKQKPDEEAFRTLESILNSREFRLALNSRRWHVSDDDVPGRSMDFQVPMACFTETPIGFLPDRMEAFGRFGIGMTIDWGVRNGAQNVVYAHENGDKGYGRTLAGVLYYIHQGLANAEALPHWYWFRELVGITEDIKFREEREWRILGRTTDEPGATDFEPKAIGFEPSDVDVVVCPRSFLARLRRVLETDPAYHGHSVGIVPSEFLEGPGA